MNNNNFEFKDWSVNRRARALDHMDQYIRKIVNVDGPDYFFWENHGIGNKSDEEVLKIAADDTAFINALFAFYLTTASDSDVFTIKKERF